MKREWATIRLVDIAREAGVSRSTVATALLGSGGNTRIATETAARVRRVASELQYRPNQIARQLKGARSNTIGVILDASHADVVFDLLRALEREAFQRGFRLIVGQIHPENEVADSRAYLDDFQARGVDGVIWPHSNKLPSGLTGKVFESLPNVLFRDASPIPHGSVVRVDYADGIRQAVRHLLSSGRQRIGMALHALDSQQASSPMTERVRGYREQLADQGRPVDERLIWAAGVSFRQPSDEVISQAIHALVEECGADAILANNDVWAVKLIKTLRRQGRRVPEDVAVVGFDNLSIATACDPELTTIDQDHQGFAHAAMDLICERTVTKTNATAGRTITIQPRLVVRASSGAACHP